MLSFRSKMRKSGLALFCVALVLFSQTAIAGTHVVSGAELQAAIQAASEQRQTDLKSVTQFLQSQLGQRAVQSSGLSYAEVQEKVALLSDQELAQLAARSLDLQRNFAAGRLSSTHITYIIIAAVAIVLIIALAAG
ncbi:MAG: PA2779 family protein [Acidobacteriota bacterium]